MLLPRDKFETFECWKYPTQNLVIMAHIRKVRCIQIKLNLRLFVKFYFSCFQVNICTRPTHNDCRESERLGFFFGFLFYLLIRTMCFQFFIGVCVSFSWLMKIFKWHWPVSTIDTRRTRRFKVISACLFTFVCFQSACLFYVFLTDLYPLILEGQGELRWCPFPQTPSNLLLGLPCHTLLFHPTKM